MPELDEKELIYGREKKIGVPPGTLVYTGEKRSWPVKISVINYDEKKFVEKEVKNVEECFRFRDKLKVTWININGIHDTGIIKKIGDHFGIHPLVLEDIITTGQRPKMENFGNHIFIVLQMLYYDEIHGEINSEQLSLILGQNYVISFQETKKDALFIIKDRIRKAGGRVKSMGADYLAYILMDIIVDDYFVILEKLGEKMEYLEEELIANPQTKTLRETYGLNRKILFLRRAVWPLRQVISNLGRSESVLINKKTSVFLGDLYDHTIQIVDTIETYRHIISGMLEIYLSGISNRMTEVMKVLTVIATIFIPLTFIAGVYGMNF